MKIAWQKRLKLSQIITSKIDLAENVEIYPCKFIENFISQEITKAEKEMVKELKSWDLGAIPQTDDYANGWNDCRKHFGKGRKRLIDYLERKK